MGFFTRHITDNSLIKFAQGELENFDTYMLGADGYNLTGEYASCFWDFYRQEKESRESLWHILRNESYNKNELIKMVCKIWVTATNKKNTLDQLDAILNYLNYSQNEINVPENTHVKKLIEVLRERVKKNMEDE